MKRKTPGQPARRILHFCNRYFGAPDTGGGCTVVVPGLLFRLDGALLIGPGPVPPGTPTPEVGELADGPGWPGAPVVAVLDGGVAPGEAAVPC